MSQEEIGEVTFRLKPVVDQSEVQRIIEQVTAAASGAVAASQRAQIVSSAASASASIAQAGSSRAAITGAGAQPALTAGVEGSYSRQAISRSLLSEMRSEIDMIQGIYEEQFNTYARPTSFAGNLPGEMRRLLQGHPNRQKIRGLISTNVPGGNAEDLMSDLGEDRYFRGLEYMAGTPLGHALEAGQKYGSPRQQWMSGFALHQAGRHKTALPVMEHVNLSALATGTRFTTGGYEQQIIEPDEGQRMLRSPFSRHDLPLDAMGMLPVDVGSLRQPSAASIDAFGDGLEGFPALPAPLDPQTARQGRRIPLPQYTKRQLALPSPASSTKRFSDYYSDPEPFNWRTGADRRQSQLDRERQAANFDPSSDIAKIRELEGLLPGASRKTVETLNAVIGGMKSRLRSMGHDPDSPRESLVTPSHVMSQADRYPPGLPPPSFQTEAGGGYSGGRYRGGFRGGGVGGGFGSDPFGEQPQRGITRWGFTPNRGGGQSFDADFEGEWWPTPPPYNGPGRPGPRPDPNWVSNGGHGWYSTAEGMAAHGWGAYNGTRPRPRQRPSRAGRILDRALDGFDRFESRMGRRGTLIGGLGRSVAGRMFRRYLPPEIGPATRGQHRMMRVGAAVRRFGNTPFMSFGNYMSLFWGGGEVANAVSALGNAGILGSMTGNMQEKAQLQLQAYQQASAGFFGRFANLAIDPFGAKQASIQATLQNSAGIDSFIDDQRTWVRSMRYAGMPSAATDVGQQFSGFAASIVGMNDARRERMSSFREQRKAFVADAVNAAGPRGIMEEGDIALWESIGLPTKRGLMVRDRMMDAANSAYANQSALMARDKLMGQQADQATITAQFNAMTMGQIREAQDANLQRAYIGNPVNGQRAAMILGFQREMQDIRNPKFQKQYMDQMKEAGFTGSQAFSMFNDFYNSVSARQSAQMQAFDAQTIYGMNLTRQSMDSSLRIADAARGVMAGTPGARAELDDANLDSEEANMKRALIDQGFGPNEAALRATMNRISHRADIGARRSRIENIRKMQEQRQFESLSSQFDVTRRGRSRVRDARRSLRENGGAFNTVTNASLVSQAESEAYSVGRAGGMERMATQLVADYFDDLDAVRSEFLSQFRPTQYDDISAIDTTGTRGRAELNALRPTFEGVQSIFNARREGYLQHLQEREARIHIEQMTNPGF